MLKVNVTVELPKATHELADAIVDFIGVAVKEVRDNGGYSTGDDLPAIAVALVSLLPKVGNFTQLGDDMKADASEFATAWALAGAKLYGVLK